MGPEALHLLDDMLAAAWNTNRAGVWLKATQYRPALPCCLLNFEGRFLCIKSVGVSVVYLQLEWPPCEAYRYKPKAAVPQITAGGQHDHCSSHSKLWSAWGTICESVRSWERNFGGAADQWRHVLFSIMTLSMFCHTDPCFVQCRQQHMECMRQIIKERIKLSIAVACDRFAHIDPKRRNKQRKLTWKLTTLERLNDKPGSESPRPDLPLFYCFFTNLFSTITHNSPGVPALCYLKNPAAAHCAGTVRRLSQTGSQKNPRDVWETEPLYLGHVGLRPESTWQPLNFRRFSLARFGPRERKILVFLPPDLAFCSIFVTQKVPCNSAADDFTLHNQVALPWIIQRSSRETFRDVSRSNNRIANSCIRTKKKKKKALRTLQYDSAHLWDLSPLLLYPDSRCKMLHILCLSLRFRRGLEIIKHS